jgi:hypothetical protein
VASKHVPDSPQCRFIFLACVSLFLHSSLLARVASLDLWCIDEVHGQSSSIEPTNSHTSIHHQYRMGNADREGIETSIYIYVAITPPEVYVSMRAERDNVLTFGSIRSLEIFSKDYWRSNFLC